MIDRVLDELWNEVRDIVQETGINTIPMEKKCKKAKWLSVEALQIAVKRAYHMEYQIVRTHWKETTGMQDPASPNHQ